MPEPAVCPRPLTQRTVGKVIRSGVAITVDEARVPMGMAKRPHIAALMAMPRVAKAWKSELGSAPTEANIDALYDCLRSEGPADRQ